MIDRRRLATIAHLALPIIGGMMSQNILNLIDTAMVGSLGAAALAGVGMASFLSFMAVGAIMGLSAGVQAIAARRLGEGRLDAAAAPLNAGLLVALVAGVPIAAVLIAAGPTLFDWLMDDPDVVEQGTGYWQARLIGMVAIGMNFSYRGFWSGIGRTRIYLKTIVTMHVLNVAISYCLIFGKLGLPALGTVGAGLGTTISVVIGSAIYTVVAWRQARPMGFLRRAVEPGQFGRLLRLAAPNSLQQVAFAAGLASLFWMIGQVSTADLAVATVMINISLVAILPAIGLGLAAGTLSGQALGRDDPADAHRWTWDVVRLSLIAFAALGLPMLLIPRLILSAFLDDPALIDIGQLPLQLFGIGLIVDGVGIILMQALLGVGAARAVMMVAVTSQWLAFLPAVYVIGPVLGHGLLAIWIAMMVWRGSQTAIFTVLWERQRWARLSV